MPVMFFWSPEFCEKSVFVKGADNQFSELLSNGRGVGMIFSLV
jgi:hypothetical protein